MNTTAYAVLVSTLLDMAGRAACVSRSLDDYGIPARQRELRVQLARYEACSLAVARRLIAYVPLLDDEQFGLVVCDPQVMYYLCQVAEPGTPAYARLDDALF